MTTIEIEEEDKAVVLSLAICALHRPGWNWMLGAIAERLSGREMFEEMKRLNADRYKPDEYPRHPDASDLRSALNDSLKLQAHYAKLLNQFDGGERAIFDNVDDWLARLNSLAQGGRPPAAGGKDPSDSESTNV